MGILTTSLVGFALVAVVVWTIKSKGNHRRPTRTSSKRKLDDVNRVTIESAQRFVDLINESLQLANESKNADTKISQLDFAREMFGKLKQLSRDHPSIELTNLLQVEQDIAVLELEFHQAHYREVFPLGPGKSQRRGLAPRLTLYTPVSTGSG